MAEFQRRIEIDFERGQCLEERLHQWGFDAMVPISVDVGDQSIFDLISDGYMDVRIWNVLSSFLICIERFESGYSTKIGLEGVDIYAESEGESVELHLYVHRSEQHGDRLTIPLKAFAAESIITTGEFIEYFLNTCPEYTEEDVQPYREYIADAREWYKQKYDESV